MKWSLNSVFEFVLRILEYLLVEYVLVLKYVTFSIMYVCVHVCLGVGVRGLRYSGFGTYSDTFSFCTV